MPPLFVISAIVLALMLYPTAIFSFTSVTLSKGLPLSRTRVVSRTLRTVKKSDVRPSLDDVERISKGQAAKKRGTGSRGVPHRLNEAERKEWDLAKKRRYLLLRGSGWRKERGDSPLANIYRQFCDAQNILCITVSRGVGNPPLDEVIIDFSPLRIKDVEEIAKVCVQEASVQGSFQQCADNSNVDVLGWDNAEQLFEEEVIWRIPVFSVVATFSERADSRRFAEIIAQKYADGVVLKEPKEVAAGLLDEESIDIPNEG